MHFLPDVWVPCDTCDGKRYNHETLEVRYRGHSIADVLEMPCGEALAAVRKHPQDPPHSANALRRGARLPRPRPERRDALRRRGTTRPKLAAELARPDTGRTLYLLDEPTTGLHFDDIAPSCSTCCTDWSTWATRWWSIEHNLDVIKTADWIIDLGPEAGDEGGYVVA